MGLSFCAMGNSGGTLRLRVPRIFKKPTNIEGVEAGTNVNRQAQAEEALYSLVKPPNDATGQNRGTLVEATAKAFNENNWEKLHDLIQKELNGCLYNDGAGSDFPVRYLVHARHDERERKIDATKKDHHSPFAADEEENKEFRFIVHDIYQSEEYYGEAVIHMALANENLEMLKIILDHGKKVGLNLQERCYGNFFCTDDQKPMRRDDPESEVVVLDPETNYRGHTYWGELPLSFAACLGQEDAVKLLIAHGADLYATDTNGNNVLHMLVIYNNKDMFNLAYRLGKENPQPGKNLLECGNRLGYTPLTLAAKLANKQLFDHILELKSNTMWVYGGVICKEYPLSDLDSIDSTDGSINSMAALNIVLEEDGVNHLDMLDGLLYQLLHDKWKSYAKVRFYRRAAGFYFYTALLIAVAYLHPGNAVPVTSPLLNYDNQSCYLPVFDNDKDYARTVLETLVFILAGVFIYFSITEIRFQGFRLFGQTLFNAPTKAGFLFSCLLVLSILPCRMACAVAPEDILFSIAICTCVPYCLFFCRGFKLVGPFIVMIYKMIAGDLLRFLLIYLIFLMGFSQAMFVLFRGTTHEFFSDWFESIMAMFLMMLGEFQDTYDTFDSSRNPSAPKLLFVIYMILVFILLLNMLIAMMGNTFNRIAQTEKEWQRQWAKIVLVIEQTVSPPKRKSKQRRYSQPCGEDGKERSLVIRTRTETLKDDDVTTMHRYLKKFQKNPNANLSRTSSGEVDADTNL